MKLSKEIKAAIFVLTSILLFIFGFNYLKGTSLLDRQKTLYAVYDEVDGLLVGANVMINGLSIGCLLYTSPSPRDKRQSRMPSSA